jgi:hypothetical protein
MTTFSGITNWSSDDMGYGVGLRVMKEERKGEA